MIATETAAARPRRADARRAPDRFIGVDIARFVAIVGMMAAHLWMWSGEPGPWAAFEQASAEVVASATAGTASALFAVLGGLSLVLSTVRVRERRGVPGVLLSVVTRGLVIMLLGMLLGVLPNSIVGVLTYFGLAMIVAAPFVIAPTAIVAVAAAVLAAFGGSLLPVVVRAANMDSFGSPLGIGDVIGDPVVALRTALLTGTYPVITWLAYMLVGVIVGRMLLSARAQERLTQWGVRAAGIGAAAAVVTIGVSQAVVSQIGTVFQTSTPLEPDELRALLVHGGFGSAPGTETWLQLVASPHTGTPAEIVRNVGVSLVVIGLCVAWFDRARRGSGEPAWATRWIQACGAAPLTIYSLHLVLSSASIVVASSSTTVPWWLMGFWAWLAQVGVALLVGLVLLLLGRRGPLETLLGFLTRKAVRLAPERAPAVSEGVDGVRR